MAQSIALPALQALTNLMVLLVPVYYVGQAFFSHCMNQLPAILSVPEIPLQARMGVLRV